ncbi:MAG: hypothetical protein KGZ59_03840 [Chitinophagaceae bacterium]|nr:hypothetical protein [Chitinophagaceae bacterium]
MTKKQIKKQKQPHINKETREIKNTFKNWMSGKVYLNTCAIKKNKKPLPPIRSISAFSEKDITSIREIQKKIFDESCSKFLEDLKKEFYSSYENSKLKLDFIEKRLRHLKALTQPSGSYFQEVENMVWFNVNNEIIIKFSEQYFKDYKYFINAHLIDGQDNNYDFIHSPESKYQFYSTKEEPLPQVYASCNWFFIMWITSTYSKEILEIQNKPLVENNIFNHYHGTIKNNFDSVDECSLYNYFHKELVDSHILTEFDFDNYIRHAFELQRPPTQLFKFKKGVKKGDIYNIFYHYYYVIAQKPSKVQTRYAELLSNYFVGYKTTNVMKNFSRAYINPINK